MAARGGVGDVGSRAVVLSLLATLVGVGEPVVAEPDPFAAVYTMLGGGAGTLVVWQFLKPFVEAWGLNVKKRLGDQELEAKTKTRAMVHDLTERMADVVDQQRLIAETLRQIAKEIEESRREMRSSMERIERSVIR